MIASSAGTDFAVFGGGLLVIAFWVLILLISILWLILPFAIFGIKPLLRDLIWEIQQLRKEGRLGRARDERSRRMFDGR